MFTLRHKPHFRELIYFWGLAFIAFAMAMISLNTPTQVEAIQEKGVLRVATSNTPMTYFIDKGQQPAGFEYELTRAFADYLGVRLELILPTSFSDLYETLRQRNAHMAASNLTVSAERLEQFDFGPPYRYSAPTVIYRIRQGNPKPTRIEDLYERKLRIPAGAASASLLARLKETHPLLSWEESTDSTADLLTQLHEGSIDFTIMDSTLFDAIKSFYPGLAKGLQLEAPQPIAWMLPRHYDGTLKAALERFFALPETRTLIEQLEQRYFSRQNQLNFFDTGEFRRAFEERYPPLEQYFMLAAQESGIDHLLLAAIAYQESHWRKDAVSPTGVRGIMMLTEDAAAEVGVTDRTDPRQSILGGAAYLVRVQAKIPQRITEPDHTWFALAGYNIGFGHLEDARILTQQAGGDPDLWEDVRRFLPRLAEEKYYSTLRYGYARGYEPVTYVDNIRKYMEILRWEEQLAQTRRNQEASRALEASVDALAGDNDAREDAAAEIDGEEQTASAAQPSDDEASAPAETPDTSAEETDEKDGETAPNPSGDVPPAVTDEPSAAAGTGPPESGL